VKKVIVFGSFDPLHKGHLNFLTQAKKLGDFLTVVVARDENIQKRKKRKVKLEQDQRKKVIEETGLADKIILGDKTGEYTIINKEKPDVIAIGYDQKMPQTLKDKLKQYRIITLKPYKANIYKSSKIV
jgi:FAD synthetase